jgi:hypothetical protein
MRGRVLPALAARNAGRLLIASVLAAATLLPPMTARAHGGLSMEQDMCKLTVGHYLMHFAGYQSDAQRSEFCEDIPHIGRTIIVLDFIDDALRDMPTEVRIVRKSDGPLDSAPLVYSLPPRVYPRGTVTLTHDFVEPGDYVGIVYAGDSRQHAAVFPFSVGADRTTPKVLAGVAALLLLGVGGFFFARERLNRAVVESRDGMQA